MRLEFNVIAFHVRRSLFIGITEVQAGKWRNFHTVLQPNVLGDLFTEFQ